VEAAAHGVIRRDFLQPQIDLRGQPPGHTRPAGEAHRLAGGQNDGDCCPGSSLEMTVFVMALALVQALDQPALRRRACLSISCLRTGREGAL
jgi:hypothetical protein